MPTTFSRENLKAGDLVVATVTTTNRSVNLLVLPGSIAGCKSNQVPGQRDKTALVLTIPGSYAAPIAYITDELTIDNLRIDKVYGPAFDWCKASINDIDTRNLLWERKPKITKEIEEFRKALDALTVAARKAGVPLTISDKPEWLNF